MMDQSLRSAARDLKDRIKLSDVVATAVKILPMGAQWQALCPFHADSTPSLSISDEKGVFFCHGCGATGDHFDFLQMLHNWSFRRTFETLSGGSLPQQPKSQSPKTPSNMSGVRAAREQWNRSKPIAGTPAALYLAKRGLYPPYPNTIRFGMVPRKIDDDGSDTTKWRPALLAKITDSQERLMALGRTFLTRDGRKAEGEHYEARLDVGRKRHNLVYLGRPALHALIAEGLEDGLTLVQRIRAARCHPDKVPFFNQFDGVVCAALGSRNMTEMDLHPMIERVTFAGDNDGPGRDAVIAAIASLETREKIDPATGEFLPCPIQADFIFPAPEYRDFNAELLQIR